MSQKPTGLRALRYAVALLGGVGATAKKLGRSQPTVSNVHGASNTTRKIPRSWCLPLEKLTGGKVSAADLRPDIFA